MRPLWIGASGPTMMSRTTECTPSAPITASAVARGAVREAQRDAPAGLIEADQLLAEMDDLGRQHRGERVVQIGAVHAQIRRAVEAFRHRQLARHLAGIRNRG